MVAKGSSMLPLRRSKSSLSSLSRVATSDLSQSKFRRSSSSLYLHGLSMESTSPSSSFHSHSSAQSWNLRNQASRNVLRHIVTHDHTTLRHAVLVLMAIPCCKYLNDLAQTLEIGLHNIPFLIALGVFPTVFLKLQKNINATDTGSTASSGIGSSPSSGLGESNSSTMSLSSLAEIEAFYRNHPLACDTSMSENEGDERPHQPTGGSQVYPADEWGHFTDIDEAVFEEAETHMGKSNVSSRSSLHILLELEEEEEE